MNRRTEFSERVHVANLSFICLSQRTSICHLHPYNCMRKTTTINHIQNWQRWKIIMLSPDRNASAQWPNHFSSISELSFCINVEERRIWMYRSCLSDFVDLRRNRRQSVLSVQIFVEWMNEPLMFSSVIPRRNWQIKEKSPYYKIMRFSKWYYRLMSLKICWHLFSVTTGPMTIHHKVEAWMLVPSLSNQGRSKDFHQKTKEELL